MSRGQFIATAAGATGAALSAPLWLPGRAQAAPSSGVLANPIPGGNTGAQFGVPQTTELFHVFGPQNGAELSTITDFNGVIAAAHLQGPAIRTLSDGTTTTLYCDYDMRFMQGLYVGVDGKNHQGTFAFF
jgi:hypothetical protein